jgi:hypothetical protein
MRSGFPDHTVRFFSGQIEYGPLAIIESNFASNNDIQDVRYAGQVSPKIDTTVGLYTIRLVIEVPAGYEDPMNIFTPYQKALRDRNPSVSLNRIIETWKIPGDPARKGITYDRCAVNFDVQNSSGQPRRVTISGMAEDMTRTN